MACTSRTILPPATTEAPSPALGRPEFIDRDVFREYLTVGRLSNLFEVGSIQAASYVSRCARLGRPIRHYRVYGKTTYRPLDVVARARVDGLSIEPPGTADLRIQHREEAKERASRAAAAIAEIPDLEARAVELRQEIAMLEAVLAALPVRPASELPAAPLAVAAPAVPYRDQIMGLEQIEPAARLDQGACGVYFLFLGSALQYIGQSVNVLARVGEHRKSKKFDRWCFVRAFVEHLDPLEAYYIHAFRPPLNGRNQKSRSGAMHAPLASHELFERIVAKPTAPGDLPAAVFSALSFPQDSDSRADLPTAISMSRSGQSARWA